MALLKRGSTVTQGWLIILFLCSAPTLNLHLKPSQLLSFRLMKSTLQSGGKGVDIYASLQHCATTFTIISRVDGSAEWSFSAVKGYTFFHTAAR